VHQADQEAGCQANWLSSTTELTSKSAVMFPERKHDLAPDQGGANVLWSKCGKVGRTKQTMRVLEKKIGGNIGFKVFKSRDMSE
jgi:hypothetical protein